MPRINKILTAPVPPLSAAERMVTLSWMVVAAAEDGDRDRLANKTHRVVAVTLDHLGVWGPEMWIDTEGALWGALHLDLLARMRQLMRAVILDEPDVGRRAAEFVIVTQRYQRVVARRYPVADATPASAFSRM